MPTLEELINVYDVLEEEKPDGDDEEERADYDRKFALCAWYQDSYLPACVGELSFGKTTRYYKMQVDSFDLKGKRRVIVEKQSEAYGLLMMENCHDKWKLIVPKKAQDPKWKVPDYVADDPTTHPYNATKYSDPRGGQAAGWKPAARTAFNAHVEKIQKRRDEDKEEGWKLYKGALDLLRAQKGITDEEPVPKGSKKRKRQKSATVQEDFVAVDDASESPYSVHSELDGNPSDDEDDDMEDVGTYKV